MRRSTTFLQGLLDCLDDVVFTVHWPGRHIEYASHAVTAVFGLRPEEVVGQTTRLLCPDEATYVKLGRRIEEALARGERRLETESLLQRESGEVFPAEIRITFIREGGQATRAVGVVRDMSGRRQAQQALVDSQRQIADILESISDGFVAIDSDWRFIYRNSQADRLMNLSPGTLLGRTVWEAFPQVRELPSFQVAQQVMADQTPRSFQEYDPSVDAWHEGTIYPYRGGISLFYRDITARKRSEEALRRQAERLRNLHQMDHAILAARSPQAIAEVSVRRIRRLVPCMRVSLTALDSATDEATVVAVDTDAPTRVSAGTRVPLAALGSVEELRQTKISRIDDLRALATPPPLVASLAAEGARSCINVTLLVQEELIGWLNLWADHPEAFSAEEMQIAAEVADHLAIAFQQARLREELERHATDLEARVAERTAQLEQTNAELESFSYSVSHDLRAPLRAMQGFAQALLEDCGERLAPACREYAERIVRAASRMDQLIHDLLTYSRVSRLDLALQSVCLDSVLEEVLVQLGPAIEESRARVRAENPLGDVRAHRATLGQVLANLLSNAIKFVRPGIAPRVGVRTEKIGARVRLWVEDNGIGIRAEHQERVFSIFERLHAEEAYTGTGIGLAIVRKAIERMGGRVGMSSEVGQGSRFWIELPGPAGQS